MSTSSLRACSVLGLALLPSAACGGAWTLSEGSSLLLFGFTTLWAYLWLSQYLLIWYANIPEETSYYTRRFEGGWLGATG